MNFTRPNRIRYSGSGLLTTLGKAAGTVINKAIDLLPVEVHAPGGYQWCGPGTDVAKRLARGDPGINKLDAACKLHDIAYSRFKDNKNRSEADRVLADRAWERFKASDSSLGEKATAWTVTNIMKAKRALGGGRVEKKQRKNVKTKNKCVKKKKQKESIKFVDKKGKGLYLKPYPGSGHKKNPRQRKTSKKNH